MTTDSIGAQCPTANSLPLLSGHGQNDTVLSGQPCPPPALVRAAGAAPAFVGAAGPGSRFCRGWRWRCTLLSGRPSARYTLLSGLLLSLPIVPGQAAPRSRFYRGVGTGAGRNLLVRAALRNQACWLQNSESLLIDRSAARFPQHQNGFWIQQPKCCEA